MISCASVKEKAKEYATRLHYAKTIEEHTEIFNDMQEYRNDLDPSERAEFDKVHAETERELTKRDLEKSAQKSVK
jgi:hypothetical protein